MNAILAKAILTSLLVHASVGSAAEIAVECPVQEISFAAGVTSKTLRGQLHGPCSSDFAVYAAAGQTLSVRLESVNPQSYFSLTPPDTNVFMHVGQSGDSFRSIVPADGDYKVRVDLMDPASHGNESSEFNLTIEISGRPLAALPPPVDAVLPGKPFHAYATINCLPFLDHARQKCGAFAIRRDFERSATIELHSAVGINRRILFVTGTPIASDAQGQMTFTRKKNITRIIFDDVEWYEIPDSLIYDDVNIRILPQRP
jgi:hypothetical protein